MISIATNRESFFDDYLIDKTKTTADAVLHKPHMEEVVGIFDDRWETNGIAYLNFFYDEELSKYRMYYLGREKVEFTKENTHGEVIRVCYAESDDGVKWVKPNLGICEFNGSKNNNIILDLNTAPYFDNFFVFKDNNPHCKAEEKYKAISEYEHQLYSYISADGINFSRHMLITKEGSFDSLNIAFWDENAACYRCYFRSFHLPGDLEGKDEFDKKPLEVPPEERNTRYRDIRYIESKDFKNWSPQKLLRFEGDEVPLYTNCIQKYFRAPHILIGFPTRYIERPDWSGAFDNLCGREERLERMKQHKRYGLAITDCVFICSRDGENFMKYDEAFMRPGTERGGNWSYGDCYPAVGFVVNGDKMSMFCPEGGFGCRNQIVRYSLRVDGFRSFHAGAIEKEVVTKPFIFSGSNLYANISTSAAGYIYFEIKDSDGKIAESCEMFGDSIDKKICFNKSLSDFSGKEVVLTMKMRDADIYSIKFGN